MGTDALALAGMDAFYGDSHVLHGLSLAVGPGRVLGLLARATFLDARPPARRERGVRSPVALRGRVLAVQAREERRQGRVV